MLRQPQLETYINHLKCVHFEVTENANSLLNNALASWKTPQTSTLWLDDFGSGYAGINAIRGYHFDYVKIDKDFSGISCRKNRAAADGCSGDIPVT